MNEEIRIYVADLAAYNAGHLHGVWIDATDDISDMWGRIKDMLKTSPVDDAEEHAVHDYEGFNGYDLHEYESIEDIHQFACFIQEHGQLGAELLNYFCDDLPQAISALEDNYCGCFKSVADFAEDLTEQTTEIPKALEYYIDYEAMGRDMELNRDILTIELGFEDIHIFWNH